MYYCYDCKKKFEEPYVTTEMWHDDGDYPSGAGGYPLPSYNYELEVCPFCSSENFEIYIEEEWL